MELIVSVIAICLCVPLTFAWIKILLSPSKGSFTWAWKLLLNGSKVRRKAWCVGVYIYIINDYKLRNQHNSFVSLGGIDGYPPTDWMPYIADFSKNDWEEAE